MIAFVFDCHYNGLSVIQALAEKKVQVYALDSKRKVGTFSRYAKFLRCPDPLVAEDQFVEFLIRELKNFEEKPVLFPVNDAWAMAVSKHKALLEQYSHICVADSEVIELLLHKSDFYSWATNQKIRVPRTYSLDELSNITNDVFPIIAKPEARRVSANDLNAMSHVDKMDSIRLVRLNSRTELLNFINIHKSYLNDVIFQEYIPGLSDCMFTVGIYADRNFQVRGIFTGRKVRGFPPESGDCILGQVESVPSYIMSLSHELCTKLKYHGIAEIEFKRNNLTGEFVLIEINPRSWSWVGITPECGVNLPWMAYLDLSGEHIPELAVSNLPDGSVKYVKILPDFINCIFRNKQVGYPEWQFSLKAWWASLAAEKLVIAEWNRADYLPFVYSICYTIAMFFRDLVRRK
jgi:D-aspartate ligase